MDRFVAIKRDDKVEIMNMMADKFLNGISDDEKMYIARELSIKLLDLMINYTSDSDRMKFIAEFMSAEMIQQMVSKILPKMIEGMIQNMSSDDQAKMISALMPSPEDIQKLMMSVIPELLKTEISNIMPTHNDIENQVMEMLPKMMQAQMANLGGMGGMPKPQLALPSLGRPSSPPSGRRIRQNKPAPDTSSLVSKPSFNPNYEKDKKGGKFRF